MATNSWLSRLLVFWVGKPWNAGLFFKCSHHGSIHSRTYERWARFFVGRNTWLDGKSRGRINGLRGWKRSANCGVPSRAARRESLVCCQHGASESTAEAFHQGLINFIRDPRNGIVNPHDYSMSMAIHHSTGTHTWTSCPRVPLSEWIQGSPLTRQWLERLAKQLNSAESFDAVSGDFYTKLTFFKTQQRGGRQAKNKPGNKSFEQLLKKRSVITIKNKDELCFARALVSAKAFVDQVPQYKNMSQGRGLQGHLAYKLHQETGVPEGMCGLPEIQRMQAHLGPQGYQIKIYEGVCGALWYCDPSFDSAPKKLCLLKVEQHFHGLRSVPALLNKTYYCHQCNKGYN